MKIYINIKIGLIHKIIVEYQNINNLYFLLINNIL